MLRQISDGKLTNHHFIDHQHALDWLKKDTANEERFTVCFASHAIMGPEVMMGYFQQMIPTITKEMTVSQFISEALAAKDKKKHDS